MNKNVKAAAAVNKQPHGVAHKGNDPKQATQHNKDMQRIDRMNRRGQS
jgi:hypothetical protein